MCDSFIVGEVSSQNSMPLPSIRAYLIEECLDVLWVLAVEDYVIFNVANDVFEQE